DDEDDDDYMKEDKLFTFPCLPYQSFSSRAELIPSSDVLKGKAENNGDYNDVEDSSSDSSDEGKLEITKYTFNNITSFKFEAQSDGSKIKSMTIRQGLPTVFGKVVLVVPGTPAKDDEKYTMTSWLVNASYVAAYNGMSVTSVIDAIYASPYAYYVNMTTSKGWLRGQMYKPLFCFWCDY
ncbi:unnamed protein product, partial [Closterium sp. NIES-54]